MTRRFFGVAILGLSLLSVVSAQSRTQLELTLAALKSKRHAAGVETYHITFEKTIFGAVLFPTGKTSVCGGTEELSIEWPSGRFREDGFTTCENSHERTAVFDGEMVRSKFRMIDDARKPTSDWKYGLTSGTHRNRLYTAEYWPLFFTRGIIVSSASQAFYPGHLLFDAPDDQFFAHRATKNASPFVLRSFPERPDSPSFYEYTVDATKANAVVDFAQFVGGDKVTSLSIEMKQYQGNWAPAAWRLTRLVKGKVSHVTKATVLLYSATTEPASGLFELTPPDGAMVAKSNFERNPDKSGYKIERSDYQMQSGKLVPLDNARNGFSAWVANNWLFIALLVALVLVASFRRRLSRMLFRTPK